MAVSKSSFNFQKADLQRAEEHNSRTSKITYLLKHIDSNKVNENKRYMDYDKFKKLAIDSYKQKHNQSMQKKQVDNLFLEAVINLKEEHNLKDIEKLFTELKKEFIGFELLDVSIHRDEGVFLDSPYPENELVYDSINLKWYHDDLDVTDEIIDYKPSKDIFYNEDTKNWYLDKEFKIKADMSKLQLKMNYHAHTIFSLYDLDTCKSARLSRTQMSLLQTKVAEFLKMERGTVWSKTKRKNHFQIKEEHAKVREQKIKKKASNNDLKEIIKQQRKELQKLGAKREEHAKLEALHKSLKIQLEDDNLSIEDIENIVSNASYFKTEYEKLKIKIDEIINENIELKESLKDVKDEVEIYKQVIKTLEADIEKLKNKSTMYLNLNADVSKELKQAKFTLTSLYNELEKSKESNKNLHSENRDLKEYIQALEIENDKLRKENISLYQTIDNMDENSHQNIMSRIKQHTNNYQSKAEPLEESSNQNNTKRKFRKK
ncbi:hypothetical protein CRV03_09025 [Arcobacter sp. F155]|uniref:hypothetical protein n=1 Tax=Arcobacter sp. F155 TaxID=2044512 RepID=UPI00100AE4AB|nr:hypothetical protein [Arcobacter sp. F155]RXJ76585.1 hypothetical protein CRV03_09025 [Arcobacter sp. F155]